MDNKQPVYNMVGNQVALGPLRSELYSAYYRWENDFLLTRTRGIAPKPRAMEQVSANYADAATDKDEVWFTIYELATGRPIGVTWWHGINLRDRTAEYAIVIGEADCRSKGYGTETIRLMLDYAFTALGLHNVMLIASAFNLGGLRAYEKAGFREFGRRKQSYMMGGKLWDDIYMECLATDFRSPVLAAVFAPDEPRS